MLEQDMDLKTLKELAASKRVTAKRIFGEALERSGFLNQHLPLSRFVDIILDTAVLEARIALKEANHVSN